MREGVRLEYFSTNERRIAHWLGDGLNREAFTWWVRTPSTLGESDRPGVVNMGGVHTTMPVYTILGINKLGVRPAFCLPNDTPVRLGEFNGEYVFFIDYQQE